MLNPLTVQTGRLETGKVKCFALFARKGEFVRASLDIAAGYARTQVLESRQNKPLLVNWVYAGEGASYPGLPLAFEVPASGWYVIELTGWAAGGSPFTMQVDEVVPAKTYAARRQALSNHLRTAWLRKNATVIRSIEPADEDFSDLAFLREQLRGVRVVLLGESDHGNGADLKAKTRLVKFLHREMGFDVLAFESGLFGTAAAWRALRTQAQPRDAFLQGVFRVWGWSEQVQPLINYLAASARSDYPLELTGFDSQFWDPASRDSMLPSLREFLTRARIDGPLADTNSRPARILAGVVEARFGRDGGPVPEPAEEAELVQSLQGTALEVEKTVRTREGQFWAQVLRSVSVQAGFDLRQKRNAPAPAGDRATRDRQMAENLVWLANTYYRGHKVIAWAHTLHTMRNPRVAALGGHPGFSMGQGVWEVLGRESFVIGMTSYTGVSGCITCGGGMEGMVQDVVADQDPSFEFEELMDAAGYKFGFVNLRRAREAGQWLGGTFAARPLFQTYRAPWSEVLDALFFIRTQEPSRRVAGVR
ncbi:MAG: erythromycin esterase family protein [Acidobacteria bacterium]|nr:erythromycin esterase family protein [Acidobacteriota bacterium]